MSSEPGAGVTIRAERPDSAAAAALVLELEAELASLYPDESRHGLSVDRLVAEGVDFFVLRVDGRPTGCGGLLFVGDDYGEIKRLYARPASRGLGLGRRMLDHLEDHARRRGYRLLRLETGVRSPEALRLYERAGFVAIPPFGPYHDDPLTLCMEKRLA
jgi:GNAT superfamily N-acetyltransferase